MSQASEPATLRVAARLAALGRYSAAERLLDALDEREGRADALLLRAKMAAQRGHYEQAVGHWQEVLSLAPDSVEARRGLHLARQLQSRVGGRFYLRANLYYGVLMLVIVGLAVLLLTTSRRADSLDADSARLLLERQEQQLRTSRESVESLRPTTADMGRNVAATDAPEDLRLEVGGVSQRADGDALVLSFEDGLFQRGGAALSVKARDELSALGRQLEPYAGKVSVAVIGHTDDAAPRAGGQFRDNAALALARAVAVIEHLRATSRLPAEMFSAHGLGAASAPYPLDTPANRARNRTAVIRISRVR